MQMRMNFPFSNLSLNYLIDKKINRYFGTKLMTKIVHSNSNLAVDVLFVGVTIEELTVGLMKFCRFAFSLPIGPTRWNGWRSI